VPNIFDCWNRRTADFHDPRDVCTRACRFCAVLRKADASSTSASRCCGRIVAESGLRHAVITSVDRDDLKDGGAGHLRTHHQGNPPPQPGHYDQVLTPDFRETSNR